MTASGSLLSALLEFRIASSLCIRSSLRAAIFSTSSVPIDDKDNPPCDGGLSPILLAFCNSGLLCANKVTDSSNKLLSPNKFFLECCSRGDSSIPLPCGLIFSECSLVRLSERSLARSLS